MKADIIQHMERHFGPVHEQALIEIVPSLNVAVNVILPAAAQDSIILFTTGMSDHAQTVPEGHEEYRYTELFIRLPAGWPMDDEALNDANNFWPFEWLRRIAAYPLQNQTWLGGPYTIIANDEPPKPLAPNTRLSCLLLLREHGEEGTIQCADGRQINLYSIIPLYAEERDLEVTSGLRELLTRFHAQDIPMTVDTARASVAPAAPPPPLPASTPVPTPPLNPLLPSAAATTEAAQAATTQRSPADRSGAPTGSSQKSTLFWVIIAGIACAVLLFVVIVVAAVGFLIRTRALHRAQARTEELQRMTTPPSISNGSPRNTPSPESIAPPTWVPIYPGLAHPPHFFRKDENGIAKGRANFDTPDSMEKVKEFFETQLKADGFEITNDKSKARLLQSAEIDAKKEEGKRTIHVTIHGSKIKTVVLETFEGSG